MGVIIIYCGNSFLERCKQMSSSLLEGTSNKPKYDSTNVNQEYLQRMVG